MSDLWSAVQWLADPDSWGGPSGIGRRLVEHLWYSLLAAGLATAIGLPIGLVIGHTGKGRILASTSAGLFRAIPTIGIVIVLFRWRPGSIWPVLVALVVLAVPPVLLNTAAGIETVDPDVVDAARGMGMTGHQRLWRVEVPIALPLILAGVRSAANQVIATATVAGFYALGGLGRFIFSGYSQQRLDVVYGAALLVVVLVLLVELVFAVLQRLVVSPGLRAGGRPRRGPSRAGEPSLIPTPAPTSGAMP